MMVKRKSTLDLKGARTLLNKKPTKASPEKIRTTLYVDEDVYRRFQKLCLDHDNSMSAILERCMRDLLGDE